MVHATARSVPAFDDTPIYYAGDLRLAVAVYADRPCVRDEMAEDAVAAGFRLTHGGGLAELHDNDARPLGEVVLIDAPVIDGATLAALARIDMRAARADAQLVVSTSLAALDDVFGCLDQSGAQVLVEPSRAERVIALGRVLAAMPRGRVRELTEIDRLTLLRLTEQVGLLAERLGAPANAASEFGSGGLRLASPAISFAAAPADSGSQQLVRAPRPTLPDPRLLRRIIRQRQLRGRFFDGGLFADPAWDMLLDLAAARAEYKRVSVTSLCIASGVPPTTALRWIALMTEAGILERVEDETDRRRAFIALTDRSADAMARYFAELECAVT
jgi:hypothetical protein